MNLFYEPDTPFSSQSDLDREKIQWFCNFFELLISLLPKKLPRNISIKNLNFDNNLKKFS